MAGAFLAIGSCISALTKNQVIAFVLGAAVCFLFMMSGLDLVQSIFRPFAGPFVLEAISSMSFLIHFDAITNGVIDLRDIVFFVSVACVFLYANVVVVDLKKGT